MILAITWNVVLICFLLFQIYLVDIETRINNKFNLFTQKSRTIRVIGHFASFVFFPLLFTLHFVLVFRGRKIINLLSDYQFLSTTETEEKKIGLKVISIQAIYLSICLILFQGFYYLNHRFDFDIYFIIRLLQFVFSRTIETTGIALIAYKSLLISTEFDHMRKSVTKLKIVFYHKKIFHLKNQIRDLDKLPCVDYPMEAFLTPVNLFKHLYDARNALGMDSDSP